MLVGTFSSWWLVFSSRRWCRCMQAISMWVWNGFCMSDVGPPRKKGLRGAIIVARWLLPPQNCCSMVAPPAVQVSLHMSGEKKGKERVRDANRRFRLSSSSLSFLIKK